jgi:hypothetical protein
MRDTLLQAHQIASPAQQQGQAPQQQSSQPVQGQPASAQGGAARRAKDGNYYVPDPHRPGKYLMVVPHAA